MNDLRKVVNDRQLVLFADDTTIVYSGKSTVRKIDEDIHSITDWFTASKLTGDLVLLENKLLTVFELYLEELVKALSKQLSIETPQKWFFENVAQKMKPTTHWIQKGFSCSTYCRTLVKTKSLAIHIAKSIQLAEVHGLTHGKY